MNQPLGRNQAGPSTTPAYIGVLPVPMQLRINLTVVARDFAETKDHACNRSDTQSQKYEGQRCLEYCNPVELED